MDRLIAFVDILAIAGCVLASIGVILCMIVAHVDRRKDEMYYTLTGKRVKYKTGRLLLVAVLCGAWILSKYIGA